MTTISVESALENQPDSLAGQEVCLEELSAADPAWLSFLKAQQPTDFFYTPTWSQILDCGYGIRTKVFILRVDGEIKLGLPTAFFDFKWFRLIHAYTPYGEFVGDNRWFGLFMQLLEKKMVQKKIHQIRLTQLFPHRYVLDPGYRSYEGCQHVLDLRGVSKESLWDGYKKNIRRDVRKALRSGVSVQRIEASEVDDYYALYRKTMAYKRVFGPHPRRLYHEIQKKLAGRGQALFLGARLGQKWIAGALLIFSSTTAYLLGNVSDPNQLSFCPNDLIIHEAILTALRRKLAFFDFMTTGEAYSGHGQLSTFKEKWGAKRYPFTVYEKDLSLLRAALWNRAWRWANAPLGSAFLRILLNR